MSTLHLVYMFTEGWLFQSCEIKPVESQDPVRDLVTCPDGAYGFHYGTGPESVGKISQLTMVSGCHFVDAIIIPTARLADYLTSTSAYHDVEELLRNSDGVTHHAHTRDGRFFTFDPERDQSLSTQVADVTSPISA